MPLPIKLEDRPLSYSSLSAFSKSPAHYIEYLFKPRTQTDSTLLGSTVDCLLLTPDLFESTYAVEPLIKGQSKAAKEERTKFASENANKQIITKAMYDKAIRMRDSVLGNETAKSLLIKGTQTQRKLTFTDKKTGLPIIGYLDITGDNLIVDLKTTQSADPDEFSRSVFNYRYHLQAAIYMEGMKSLGIYADFFWLCVESSSPYGCSVVKPHEDVIKLGRQELRKLLDFYKFCLDNDLWKQSYDFWRARGHHELQLPGYMKQKLDK